MKYFSIYFKKNQGGGTQVLNKISEAYQDYSGKSKRRGIDLTKKYLSEQIIIYKDIQLYPL